MDKNHGVHRNTIVCDELSDENVVHAEVQPKEIDRPILFLLCVPGTFSI